MILYLIRHGLAAERGTADMPDSQRPLTGEGVRRMRQNARGLHRLDLKLDAIWTSPLTRARQTADLLATEFSISSAVREEAALRPDTDVSKLLEPLRREPKNTHIALVGHEPYLGQLATYLLTGLHVAAVQFRKGGAACIQVDSFRRPIRGQLLWVLTPTQMRRIKKKQ